MSGAGPDTAPQDLAPPRAPERAPAPSSLYLRPGAAPAPGRAGQRRLPVGTDLMDPRAVLPTAAAPGMPAGLPRTHRSHQASPTIVRAKQRCPEGGILHVLELLRRRFAAFPAPLDPPAQVLTPRPSFSNQRSLRAGMSKIIRPRLGHDQLRSSPGWREAAHVTTPEGGRITPRGVDHGQGRASGGAGRQGQASQPENTLLHQRFMGRKSAGLGETAWSPTSEHATTETPRALQGRPTRPGVRHGAAQSGVRRAIWGRGGGAP